MGTILFVCTGNTCRSPMAEYLLRNMLEKRNVEGWNVKSAGIAAYPGGDISKETLKVLQKEEIAAENHDVKQVDQDMVDNADIILTMTESHKEHLQQVMDIADGKLHTLKELIGEQDLDILDPFGQSLPVYEKTKMEIKKALSELIGGLDQFVSKEGKLPSIKNNMIRSDKMKIAIGSDHAGYEMKEKIKSLLEEKGLTYQDMGTDSDESVDYPDFAYKVANGVAEDKFDKGILICGTGIGMSIAANKLEGVRAALCHDVFSARATRNHNNSNVLTIGSRIIGINLAEEIVKTWLGADFDGGRHERRVGKIDKIERGEY